jgi:hypothetical protein
VLVVAGATKSPPLEIVPALADQVTAGLLVLVMVAVNWIFPFAATLGFAGEIWTFEQATHGPTTIVKVCVPESAIVPGWPGISTEPAMSVTKIVNWEVPAWVGSPEMLPVRGFNARPGGNAPPVTRKL